MSMRLILSFVALSFVAPASAHHTFVSKYDGGKLIHLTGTVSDVSYKNPHIYFTLATAGGSWTIETESISVARGAGLTETVLKVGAAATVMGWPAKSGGAQLGLKSVTIGNRTINLRGSAR